MGTVLDFIASATADLTREIPAPTGDLGWGSDLDCADDLTHDLAELAGDSPRAVAQAIYHRLATARGSLPDDPDYGLDVRRFRNQPFSAAYAREVEGQIRLEVCKDDRVEDAVVTVTMPTVNSLRIVVMCTTAEGSFSLTLAVTDAGTLLEAFNAA